jgi:hypothetical protein
LSSYLLIHAIFDSVVLLASGVLGLLLQLGNVVCAHLLATFASVCLDLLNIVLAVILYLLFVVLRDRNAESLSPVHDVVLLECFPVMAHRQCPSS